MLALWFCLFDGEGIRVEREVGSHVPQGLTLRLSVSVFEGDVEFRTLLFQPSSTRIISICCHTWFILGLFFKAGSHYIAQAGLKYKILYGRHHVLELQMCTTPL